MAVLIRYRGSSGMDRSSFLAMAWKLFHKAIILLGSVGVSTVTESRATV